MAKVSVSCQACADLQTEVRVTYAFVGLSDSGNQEIAAMSAQSYEEKMNRWQSWIHRLKRIRLIGIDDHLRQVVEEACDDFAKVYGASLGESKGLVRGVVSQTLALLVQAPRAAEWSGYLVADPQQAVVVGTCGFKHGPDADGTVEIAYFTFPEFEGRGYATAMARELLKRGLQSGAVREVIAHTLPERNPSTRVLEKVGLQRAGEAHDAEVGKVWRWACRRLPAILLCVALLAVGSAWAQTPSFPSDDELQGKKSGELVTKLGTYGATDADWGFLFVPENRTRPDSRLLRLVVVRQRAEKGSSSPPIFNLVGGPGSSNIWGSGDFAPRFYEHNDIVRVGYRGIDSDVELRCPEFTKALQTERPLSGENIEETRKVLRACNDRLRAEGTDVDGYNLAEVVRDIEAARKALGYEQINLLAVSWGTQIAYAYAIHHPDRVQRMLLIGAGGRSRGFDLWDPKMVDRKLRAYGALWKENHDAVARTPDIVETIRRVLATLPREWRKIQILPDKVRLAMWAMLGETKQAAQVFDAFVAAEEGDYGGLALLSWGYDDELRRELARAHGPYHGEFFSKVMSSGLDPRRNWVREMDAQRSIIGSPAGKLLWGAASRGGWPIQVVPKEYRRDTDVDIETLVLMGNLDVSAPVEYVQQELMPHLKRGRLTFYRTWGMRSSSRSSPRHSITL